MEKWIIKLNICEASKDILTFTFFWNANIIGSTLRHLWVNGLLSAFLLSFTASYRLGTVGAVVFTFLNAVCLGIFIPLSVKRVKVAKSYRAQKCYGNNVLKHCYRVRPTFNI